MPDNTKTLTTAEYAKRFALSVSTVTRMLRAGKLSGEKRGGKWVIFEKNVDVRQTGTDATPAAPAANGPAPQAGDDAYPIADFARMTYLTEKGVRQFLASGRLTGRVDAKVRVRVNRHALAANHTD